MIQSTDTVGAFGARNRAYAEANFDQRKILAAHEQFMLKAIGDGSVSEPAA
jgi:hypothetical protein